MSEFNRLAHTLALEAATERLISSTKKVEVDQVDWRDIDAKDTHPPLGVLFKYELRYLKLRGAIV
jgi:hypothetical protein